METAHINIIDDFNARKIYEGMQSYSRGSHNKDKIEFLDSKADKDYHKWEEDTLKFINLKTIARLRLYSYPDKPTDKGLPSHALEIEILGEEQAREKTLERIEAITGIKIREKDL